jgi:septal ring factor EnvC (AmiA/AmiB activator)
MLAGLRVVWALIAGSFHTLLGGNSEARADFTALVNTLQQDNNSLRAELKETDERFDKLEAKLDAVQAEVYVLRAENAQLRAKLAESDRQHYRDEQTIGSLTARVATLEGAGS